MRALLMFLLLGSLFGCGDDVRAPDPKAQSTVLDDQIAAMEKAKAVEAKSLEQKRKLDEQLDNGG